MKVEELRINNRFLCNGVEVLLMTVHQGEGVGYCTPDYKTIYEEGGDIQDLKPIILTEGRLKEFGFKWNEGLKAWELEGFSPWVVGEKAKIDGVSRWVIYNCISRSYVRDNIIFVHTFQNVCFELECNLKY